MNSSIITINYNKEEGLRKTMGSMAAEIYRIIECIGSVSCWR